MSRSVIGITMGDPAGIGPEILWKAYLNLKQSLRCDFCIFGNSEVYSLHGIHITQDFSKRHIAPGLSLNDLSPGVESKCSGELALAYLTQSVRHVQEGRVFALLNAPVSKKAISFTLPTFLGHTQFYEFHLGTGVMAMMGFMGRHFNLLLLTHHQPLATVSQSLKTMDLEGMLRFGIKEFSKVLGPGLVSAVAGFNPHAGESGLMDQGEDESIRKAVSALQQDYQIQGPIPADSLFTARELSHIDLVFACYHDQGLIPFKSMHAPGGFSITLGLQVPRVTVDHGTAYSIAGRGVADAQSLTEAWGFLDQFLAVNDERCKARL